MKHSYLQAIPVDSHSNPLSVDKGAGTWPQKKLRDLCENNTAINPEKYPEESFTYIDVSSISNQSFSIIETKKIKGKNAPSRARKLIRTNDVIFATVRPALKRVALIHPEFDNQICSTGFCVLRSKREILDANYLFFYLLTEKVMQYVLSLEKGALYPAINDGELLDLLVPLPPLPEQRAIAYVLQTTQDAIQVRRKELALERERKAALMQHLFTHGTRTDALSSKETRFGNIPSHWDIQLLDQCAIVQTGLAKGRKLEDNHIVILPYLRVANVQDGYLDLAEIKTIELRSTEVERYKLYPGDVLVTEGGDFDKLGRGFLWKGEIPECVHQNHIFAIRARKAILMPEYLAYLIQSNYGKAYFLSVAHKTTNLACINSSQLKAFPTLLPSLDEQQEIATILQACDSKIAALEKEIALQEELFRALLDELMTDRLSTLPLVE